MAAKTAFSQKKMFFCVLAEHWSLRSLLRAVALRGCINMSYRVRGKDKNEKENRERVQNEKRSRGRVKMRNGVGEATGGTWPTYSRGGRGRSRRRCGRLRSGREKEEEREREREKEGGGGEREKQKGEGDAAGTERRALGGREGRGLG